VKEAEKNVTVAAGSSQEVSFSVAKEEAGSYDVAVDGLSGSFTVVAPPPPPEPAAFLVTGLSIQPAEVEPKEAVTVSVSVSNTGGTDGSYTVVLKINGVKEAEKNVTVAAGSSQEVNFSVAKKEAGSYDVAVDGLSGRFSVVAPPLPPLEPEKEVPTKPELQPINWPLIGGIIGAVIVVALTIIYFLRKRTTT